MSSFSFYDTEAMGETHHDTGYEQAHLDGEASANSDWETALEDLLPEGVEPFPDEVAAYIRRLQRQVDRLPWREVDRP